MKRANPLPSTLGKPPSIAPFQKIFDAASIMKIVLFAAFSVLLWTSAGCRSAGTPPEPTNTSPPADLQPPLQPTATIESPTAVREPTATQTVESAPEYLLTRTACPFNEAVLGLFVECYRITVPEDHNNPDNGRTIELPVAVIRTNHPDPAPDPILYLSGGPGENALQTLQLNFSTLFKPLLGSRDLIMFDQRGTGGSTPALNCPEVKAYIFEYLDDDLDLQTTADLILESYRQCYERLAGEGVNFSVYNSAQNAADVAMLRKALGFAEWNLLGASYGTRLVQTILRDDDAGVRSVILDSTYPVEVNLQTDTPANMKQAMDIFFAACDADEACRTTYPDLENVFWDLVQEFNEAPFLLTTANIFTREPYETLIYGESLLQELFRSLYSPEVTALFPQMIYDLRDGNTDLLARFLSRSLSIIDFVSMGMQMTVQCREEIHFTDPIEAAAAVAEYDQFGSMFVNGSMTGLLGLDICALWETGAPADIENKPVSSDVPTLIIHGEFDPITPPAWGRQVAERFSRAYFFEFPAQGHGPSFTSDCARQMVLEFIDIPQSEPDSSCIAEMGGMDFAVPFKEEMIQLTPYTSDIFGISGLIPDGWIEAGPGVHTQWGHVILQQAAPGMAADRLASLVMSQFGLNALPEPAGERKTDAFNWTLYQFSIEIPGQGQFEIDLALAEANGTAFIVLLQTSSEDYSVLHESIFMPVLETITIP